jgi:hypothetical protein
MAKHNPEKLTKVTIEVTERLIKVGTPNDTVECPVALALRKVLAKGLDLDAGYDLLTVSKGEFDVDEDYDVEAIPTPARVEAFMHKMDARDSTQYDECDEPLPEPPLPKPFSFKIKVRNKFLRPGLRT